MFMRMHGAVCMRVFMSVFMGVSVCLTVHVLVLVILYVHFMGVIVVRFGCAFYDDVNLGCGEAATQNFARLEPCAEVECSRRLFKQRKGHARIHEGAEHHVTADSGKALQVTNSH